MALDAESFLALCKELRKLGACKVEGYGFSATFVPQGNAHLPKPEGAPAARAARTPRKAEPASLLTPEQTKELAYARELGKAR